MNKEKKNQKEKIEQKAQQIAKRMGRNYVSDAMREMAKDELKKLTNK